MVDDRSASQLEKLDSVAVISHAFLRRVDQRKFQDIARVLGVHVHLLVPRHWRFYPWQPLETAAIGGLDGVSVSVLPTTHSSRTGAYLFEPVGLVRFLRHADPGLVHVEEESFSLVSAQVAAVAHVLQVPYSLFVWENIDKPLSPLRRFTRMAVLRHATGVVSGNSEALELCRRHGYRGPGAVLPQVGVTVAQGASDDPDFGGEKLPMIGFSGRLVPEKGVDVLLQAVARMRARGEQVRVRIIGDGPRRLALQALAETLGVGEIVSWTGRLPTEEARHAIGELDVLVLPSLTTATWKEQFGLVLAEAMVRSVPVVGSRSGAIPEVIGDDRALFEEGDAEDLARVLSRLLFDPALRADLAERAAERARARYSREAVAIAYAETWKEFVRES